MKTLYKGWQRDQMLMMSGGREYEEQLKNHNKYDVTVQTQHLLIQ